MHIGPSVLGIIIIASGDSCTAHVQIAATLGHSTTFTYIGVRDAAAAIVAALQRGQPGKRYLVSNPGCRGAMHSY